MASRYRKREQTDNHTSPNESKHDCSSTAIIQPQEVQDCLKVSLPIMVYVNAPASTVNNLENKLSSHGDVPSGISHRDIVMHISLFTHNMLLCVLYCIVIGWRVEVKDGTLVFFKCEILNSRPEISLSLTVNGDFSWSAFYHKQCINKESCCVLRDIPSTLDTGM